METKLQIVRRKGIIVCLIGVSMACKSSHQSLLDVTAVQAPSSEFRISESPISDNTFGQVSFDSTGGKRVELYVFPNPPTTDDTRKALRSVQESYREMKNKVPKDTSSFVRFSSSAEAFWRKKTVGSSNGEVNCIYYFKNATVQTIVSNIESLETGVEVSNQAIESNLKALRSSK